MGKRVEQDERKGVGQEQEGEVEWVVALSRSKESSGAGGRDGGTMGDGMRVGLKQVILG